MNITEEIGKEAGISKTLHKIPEIQVYANSSICQYQWRDSRFTETADVWKNESYDTRKEMRDALIKHLECKGYINTENKTNQ